jgi:DNA-binding transcriptional ArsR family regulator
MSELDPKHLPAYRSVDEILSHPRFPAARDAFVEAILALYEYEPAVNRLVEAGRGVLFIVIMCLHARYDEADRATWPTPSLVTRSTLLHDVSSARRIHSLVAQFIDAGYLEARLSPRDRRVRILTPTATMLEQDQDWLVAQYLPLQTLFPQPGYARIMQRDPSFQRAQRLAASSFFAHGAQIMASNPIVMQFMRREAGITILMKLMQLVGRKGAAAREEIFYSDIGKRLGVSRTHVRKVLQEAEDGGLVRLTKRGGRFVEIAPALVQAFDRFVADAMSGHDLLYQLALRLAS